jgi:hypothetical protein
MLKIIILFRQDMKIFLQHKTEMPVKSDLSSDSYMLFVCDVSELTNIIYSLSLLLTVPLLTFRTKNSHTFYIQK